MELMIVTGLISIIVMTAMSVLLGIHNTYVRSSMRLDTAIEEALGQRAVWLNLVNSGPSYNNLIQADDNGRQFFDLFTDVGRQAFTPAELTRVRALTNVGDSIHFLLFDRPAQPVVYYDVANAYDITPGADTSLTGLLTYSGVNRAGYVDRLNRAMWRAGKLLMLYSPTSLRAPAAPLTTPTRFTIFTGRVTGTTLTPDTAGGLIRNTHPVTTAAIPSPDAFFRTAPPVGGVAPFVFLAGVELIRYRIAANPAAATGKMLQRQVWDGGAWGANYPVAVSVSSVIFRRPSVIIPTINVDMQF